MQPFYHRSGKATIRKFSSLPDNSDWQVLAIVEHRSHDAAEHCSSTHITHRFPTVVRQIRLQCMREVHEWKRLQPHASWSCERGEKDAVATEEHVADALNARDVESDARLECADMTRMYTQRLTRLQIAHDGLAAQLQPGSPIAINLLQQESVAAEDARAERLLKTDAELN